MRTPDKAEALVRLTGLVDQLETLRLRVIAASDDVADQDGAPNVASWLAPRGAPPRPADRLPRPLRLLGERVPRSHLLRTPKTTRSAPTCWPPSVAPAPPPDSA